MNLLKINFKKRGAFTLQSLKPKIFDIESKWFLVLLGAVIIFFIEALIGLKMAHTVYFETYRKKIVPEDFEVTLNLNKLKSAIERREEVINQEFVAPRDPAI